MYVRMRSGRHAGKIVYTPAHIGKVLVSDGRAELPNTEPSPVVEAPALTPSEALVIAAETHMPRRRKTPAR